VLGSESSDVQSPVMDKTIRLTLFPPNTSGTVTKHIKSFNYNEYGVLFFREDDGAVEYSTTLPYVIEQFEEGYQPTKLF
jgi:hypothetical protein